MIPPSANKQIRSFIYFKNRLQPKMDLNEKDKNQIIELIKAGEKLPKEFIYKLFSDEEDVFLFWKGANPFIPI